MGASQQVYPPVVGIGFLVSACVVASVGAQEARWVSERAEVTGGSQEEACQKGRAEAAAAAHDHLGLDIRDCVCEPLAAGDGAPAGYRCLLAYDVLIRAGGAAEEPKGSSL